EPLPPEPRKVEEPKPGEWLYRSVWKTAFPAPANPRFGERALVFLDSYGVGLEIVERMRAGRSEVVTVRTGPRFAGDPASGYTLDPGEVRHYASLWEDMASRQRLPDRVLHF